MFTSSSGLEPQSAFFWCMRFKIDSALCLTIKTLCMWITNYESVNGNAMIPTAISAKSTYLKRVTGFHCLFMFSPTSPMLHSIWPFHFPVDIFCVTARVGATASTIGRRTTQLAPTATLTERCSNVTSKISASRKWLSFTISFPSELHCTTLINAVVRLTIHTAEGIWALSWSFPASHI
jgi:hypothetical protein